jgi:site-specific DNA-methyltransferase (adenine-specific)
MAMFPPSLPHVFIDWLTERGDVVYDPFAGRGTVPLEAALMERVGLGSDNNPMACLLTGAKVDPPEREDLLARIATLRRRIRPRSTADVPPHVKALFSEFTLARLVWLRSNLDLDDAVDRFLMALLIGRLHGNADSQGRPAGLTVAMPNTFAMAPKYVSRYIEEHGLEAPVKNPLDLLQDRVTSLPLPRKRIRGRAWSQDARERIAWPPHLPAAKLVFTSPPYLSVMKYGKFNWIRLWMLGHEPASVDAGLFTSSSLEKYTEFLTRSVVQIRRRLRDDGYVCLVIGDVRLGDGYLNLAGAVERSLIESGLRHLGTVVDDLPVDHKVSRIWGDTRGRATKTDRVMILAGPNAVMPGPVPAFVWRE